MDNALECLHQPVHEIKTMQKMIKYPSTEQFKAIVGTILRQYNFVGLDENGNPVYDGTRQKPVIDFIGTVKCHGTNAAVSFNNTAGLWFQSKENIITTEKDNAGFAFFASAKQDVFRAIIEDIAQKHGIDLNTFTITIYGEWAGGNIQKKVGLENIPKTFFTFGVKISNPQDEDFTAYWIEDVSGVMSSHENRIYNIFDFETYKITVDFNNPQMVQNQIVEITNNIEKECPVAKAFGFPNTIGEGVVFTAFVNGVRHFFKSKGEEHAVGGKVKVVRPVDNEKLAKIIDIADKVTPVWRLDQMLTEACGLMNGGFIERRKMGDYIKLVMQDIIKEDTATIIEAGLDMKDINSKVSDIAKQYFFQREAEANGLS